MIAAARDLEGSLRALGWEPPSAGPPTERAADVLRMTGVDPSDLYGARRPGALRRRPAARGTGGGGVARGAAACAAPPGAGRRSAAERGRRSPRPGAVP